jgi:hypothetical protein
MTYVLGSASMRRTGAVAFPVAVFVGEDGTSDGEAIARLGRDGWFRLFLGRGRRVEVASGEAWRVTGAGSGPYIVPIVTCERGKLAVAAPRGKRSYGITGRDFAYHFYPSDGRGRRGAKWTLREHDVDLATFESQAMHAVSPVPLAAALLGFTLIKYGVAGEADLGIPEFRWSV